ncbi:phosphonoacetaldehyde hydrolase [Halobacillus shinanisalinarum]|uniref:Phosphonoacetaldehyde hydrolase n=1 Tax=Halobacillus shinanisalinarum TaxID=2932258 RepID=A0ABY4H346_9BACI|nr:phosphonoacetaldehyde hydrolase [Halobacillus shinanisalinarum]UOQ94870.1 phosphonoacetaldehyde hydrolase [Halobacillus shinanisalinarum]
MNKIEAVVFDWAGTTIDYGCFAPLEVFLEIFRKQGVEITVKEARGPMGMLKIEHIRALLAESRIHAEWVRVKGVEPTEEDVHLMNNEFEKILFEALPRFATPISGVPELVSSLRSKGIKIGATTGYTKKMMEIVAPRAAELGYAPDCYFTADDVKAGRPYPWMCYRNAEELDVYPMNKMMKVGDTATDMKEGKNAGMISIGVVLGGSELGLSEQEVKDMDTKELEVEILRVKERLTEAGADYVITKVDELENVIDQIEGKSLQK